MLVCGRIAYRRAGGPLHESFGLTLLVPVLAGVVAITDYAAVGSARQLPILDVAPAFAGGIGLPVPVVHHRHPTVHGEVKGVVVVAVVALILQVVLPVLGLGPEHGQRVEQLGIGRHKEPRPLIDRQQIGRLADLRQGLALGWRQLADEMIELVVRQGRDEPGPARRLGDEHGAAAHDASPLMRGRSRGRYRRGDWLAGEERLKRADHSLVGRVRGLAVPAKEGVRVFFTLVSSHLRPDRHRIKNNTAQRAFYISNITYVFMVFNLKTDVELKTVARRKAPPGSRW